MGEPIQIAENDLWRKYRMISRRPTARGITIPYPAVISEIVAGKLLNRNDDGYIYASEKVFKKLESMGSELVAEVSEM